MLGFKIILFIVINYVIITHSSYNKCSNTVTDDVTEKADLPRFLICKIKDITLLRKFFTETIVKEDCSKNYTFEMKEPIVFNLLKCKLKVFEMSKESLVDEIIKLFYNSMDNKEESQGDHYDSKCPTMTCGLTCPAFTCPVLTNGALSCPSITCPSITCPLCTVNCGNLSCPKCPSCNNYYDQQIAWWYYWNYWNNYHTDSSE